MLDFRFFNVVIGDAAVTLRLLPAECIRCCVSSPPYFGLRDYGVEGQIGLEPTPEEFVARLVDVFMEVHRVLTPDGTLWLNIGDSYAGGGCGARDPERWPKQSRNDHMPKHVKKHTGCKPKDLIGVPWMVAFALRAAGWWLRDDIIWAKPNPMPESCGDRPTRAHEYVFLLSKSERYYYDAKAISEPSVKNKTKRRNKRSVWYVSEEGEPIDVWTVGSEPKKVKHYAAFPTKLIEPCILAGSQPGDVILDPFNGTGTTGVVAIRHGRRFFGVDLHPRFVEESGERLKAEALAKLAAQENAA